MGAEVQQVQLFDIRGNPSDGADQEPPPGTATLISHSQPPGSTNMRRGWKWWSMVLLNIFFQLATQAGGVLIARFYYNEGGNSMWMMSLLGTAGAPLTIVPLLLFPSLRSHPSAVPHRPPFAKIATIYVVLGLLVAGDNLMYSYALLYLPVSTFSLVCASQLAFNVVFSHFLNRQRFGALILNSIVLLTFSSALVGVDSDSDSVPHEKFVLGFVLSLGASAIFSLIFSLVELTFEKVIKREDFAVVIEVQMWIGLVASCACVVGLFASGEWRSLRAEMEGFRKGGVSYVMTLVWLAIVWQVANVTWIGLIFLVSSLFSNVVNTLSLPLTPIFAVIFFHDKMGGVKVIALLTAMWGFFSYVYQLYLDYPKPNKAEKTEAAEVFEVSASP